MGDTAAVDGTACPAAPPPELPTAGPQGPGSNGVSSWTVHQPGQLFSRHPVSRQQGSPGAAAASNSGDAQQRAPSPGAAPPVEVSSWMTSSLFTPGRQPLHEAAEPAVLDISGSTLATSNEPLAATASPGLTSAPCAHRSDQNLGCLPAAGQKHRWLQQKQKHGPSPGNGCHGSTWKPEPSGGRCSKDRVSADGLPCRASSRDSTLSFEALATRSHTSGLDLSTVCWLISGDHD